MDAKTALDMATEAKSYWSEIYQDFRSDVRFSIGMDHWSDEDILRRGEDGCLVLPVLPQFIHQVVNDMRQNTPSINVIPGDGEGSDDETAKIFKGLIRNIEYKSNADEVYDTGGEYAVRGGIGFARIDHDYIDDDSFLQELKLRRVQNPEGVYIDPSSVECDGSDAEYGFALDPITRKEFEEKYPGKKFVSFDNKPSDPKREEITICEFFIKEYKVIDKQLTDDGEVIDNVPDEDEEKEKAKRKRKLKKVTVRRYKFSGEETLEETTFPGKYIPIVPFYGEEVWIDGKRNLLGLIRLAKDAQRRVNKWATKESELLDMAPIAPVMAPVGAVDDFMNEWGNPGDVNVMRYRMTNAAGEKLDKPERLAPPAIPTGIINAMEGAKESVKEALGMYNASIGQRSNEVSGVAIDARKVEGEVATFHFADNRNRSIQHIGRILVYAIPEVYDTARVIQITGEEEDTKTIGINGAAKQKGQDRSYDLRKGRYEVRVITGASYTTKRQEAAALFGDVIKGNPELMGVIGDLWAKNLDVAGASAMAARIKKTIPSALTAGEDDSIVDPEKVKMTQIIQQSQAQIAELSAELNNKKADTLLKLEEIKVKQAEVAIKEQEVQIKAFEASTQATHGPSQPMKEDGVRSTDDSIEILQQKIQQKLIEQQQAEAMAAQQQQQMLMQQEQQQQVAMQEEMDKQQQREYQQALMQGLVGIQQSIGSLIQTIQTPKQVMRDENGVIVGVA